MSDRGRYAAADLRAFCAQALERAGARAGDAAIDRRRAGRRRPAGRAFPRRAARRHLCRPPARRLHQSRRANWRSCATAARVLVADAQAGPGIAMAVRAMDLAIARAQAHGIAAVSVRNGNHCGMLAFFAMRALPAGAVGIAVSNGDSLVAPWGARAKFLGTNPLAVAVPAHEEPPVVLDMATSVVAHARVKGAADRGEAIPADWAVDSAGRSTTDPCRPLPARCCPFGGFKGSGISLLIDLLAGVCCPAAVRDRRSCRCTSGSPSRRASGTCSWRCTSTHSNRWRHSRRRVDETVRRIRALPPAAGASRGPPARANWSTCARRNTRRGAFRCRATPWRNSSAPRRCLASRRPRPT